VAGSVKLQCVGYLCAQNADIFEVRMNLCGWVLCGYFEEVLSSDLMWSDAVISHTRHNDYKYIMQRRKLAPRVRVMPFWDIKIE